MGQLFVGQRRGFISPDCGRRQNFF